MLTSSPPQEEVGRLDLSRIAQDLQIRKVQVEAVVQLLDEGNTIPFITRYRKERTGGLDEEVLRTIQERVGLLRQLAERKQTILKSIAGQDKLTDELRAAILAADNPKRLEDLYLPYKPKKRTLATAAREKGLEPLALSIWNRDPAVANLDELLPQIVNPEKELATVEDVKAGVQHILAEKIAEAADVRAGVRAVLWDTGKLCTTKSDKLAEGQGLDYKDYFQFNEPIRHIPPHRILAINRGEKENALLVKFEWDAATGQRVAEERLPLPLTDTPLQPASPPPVADATASGETPPAPPTPAPEAPPPSLPAQHHPHERRGRQEPPVPRGEALRIHPHAEFLKVVTADALSRLLVPSLEREIRRELTQRAESHAVHVFARNLRSKLLAAPLRGKRVLAIDPGYRTGCKIAALDETGNLLEDGIVYPHSGANKRNDAKARLAEIICRHQTPVIAIGNGTACRETEEIVSEVIGTLEARSRGEEPAPVAPSTLSPTPAPEAAAAPPQEMPAAPPPETPPAPQAEMPPAPPAESPPALPAETLPAPEAIPAAETPPPAEEAAAAPVAPVQPPAPPAPPLPPPPPDVAYVIVNEAGASVYSASPVGREEFPSFDATLRGTISIGRRLQDPLSELVKIDPQHVGVGLYQHDVSPKQLRESLDGVVESCVNTVGVDLNTASVPLLRHVSGLNQLVARDLVEYRKANGPFQSRDQLLQVPGIGEQRFIQSAGFLKLTGGVNPLDRTWIHPESYPVARQVLADLGFGPEALEDKDKLAELREKLKTVSADEVAGRLQVGMPTVRDLLDALARPGRDPREDLPPPIFKKGILKLEDLQPGMELKGTVLNVVDFGAFIDIGLKDSGLVHISEMANRYVKSPYDVVVVGDVVHVWVISVDKERRRVSLTMIQPGTERKPPEKKAPPPPRRDGPPPRRDGAPPPRQEGGQQRPYGARPPQRGGQRGGPPPRGGQRPQPAPRNQGQQTEPAPAAPAPTAPPPPPRKPRRTPPKPNLSQSALAGASPLGTFAELAAFWEAKKVPPPEPAPPAAESAPAPEPAPEPTPAPPPEPPVATEGSEPPPPQP